MCSSKWRLPTKNELIEAYHNKIEGFVSPRYYWSSASVKDDPDYAWGLHFSTGNYDWDNKDDVINVRLIKGAEEYLEWHNKTKCMSWNEAQKYIDKINAKGELDV